MNQKEEKSEIFEQLNFVCCKNGFIAHKRIYEQQNACKNIAYGKN